MISEVLKKLREEKGLYKNQVALELKMPYTTYNNYEVGVSEPNITVLKKIAKFYNVSLDILLEMEDGESLQTEKILVNGNEEEVIIAIRDKKISKDRLLKIIDLLNSQD